MLELELLEPELAWGTVMSTTLCSSLVLTAATNGTFYLTYGVADRHVDAAVFDETLLLSPVRAGSRR